MSTRKAELPSTIGVPHQLIRAGQAGAPSTKSALGLGGAARGVYAWVTQSASARGEPARHVQASMRPGSDEPARLRRERKQSENDSAWSPTIPSVMDM